MSSERSGSKRSPEEQNLVRAKLQAALYERRQITEISWYVFGGHRPPLQARPLAAMRESQTAKHSRVGARRQRGPPRPRFREAQARLLQAKQPSYRKVRCAPALYHLFCRLDNRPTPALLPRRFMKLSATTTFAARLGLALVLVVVVVVTPTGGPRGF